ncbi:hypothetical protein E4U41_000113 [Claviceps citrina]|nr:hypothetical protein E4U41_000113 [Claviceps citrina]
MIPSVILQLALWTCSASAFYPYTPVWLKEQNEASLLAKAKRDAASNSASNSATGGVAFTIEHRASQNDESPAQRAAKQAIWLRTKFAHTRAEASAVEEVSIGKRSGNKYNVMEAAKPSRSMAAGINQDGTDYSYFVKARLGSRNDEVYLLLDTGAGSSWVMSSSCTDEPCTTHNTYGLGDSATLVDKHEPFTITYGSGNVQGTLASDTISVGGISVKYTFGLATKTSDDFSHFAFDGILGMSHRKGVSDNFLSVLADAKKLEKNIFGVALNRAADGYNNGEIRFGATNPDKYQGDINYTPLGPKGIDWSIIIDDMAYDGKKAGSGGVLAYIDTGTTFVFGPGDKVKKIHAVIPGSSSGDGQTYTVPCDSNRDLTFTFSGIDYKLSPQDWISPKNSDGKCTSNIYGHEVIPGAWLVGDTFLKSVYTVFDRDQGRVGFAAVAGSQDSTSSSPSRDGSEAKTTVGPSTGTATGSPSDSSGLAMGLSGHETVASGATGSGNAAAKPTESSQSAAADVGSWQYAKLGAVVFSVTALILAA